MPNLPQVSEIPSPPQQRRSTVRRSLLFAGLLVILVSVFTVLGVSQVMELGSAAFFIVVVAGVFVLLLFFCGLIAYARAKLLSVHAMSDDLGQSPFESVPVFYYLQTIHRQPEIEPINDFDYWLKSEPNEPIKVDDGIDDDQCPICLCEIDHKQTATGMSACCRRQLHVKCAQDYFNTIRQVKCVFCRKNHEDVDTTAALTPSPLASPRANQV
jgi:hypothetical protein